MFEEGYLRPDYITVEEGGANRFSSLPRDPAYYRAYRPPQPEVAKAQRQPVKYGFWFAAVHAMVYAASERDRRVAFATVLPGPLTNP
ncbi:hypothetical protein [Halochromatium salexigens]|uniref:capsular polysaccharide export protein, LipB/KpsS family n=1 Tax=Halochromatium salexigens TaxID=49447 RepID=UPI0030B854AC